MPEAPFITRKRFSRILKGYKGKDHCLAMSVPITAGTNMLTIVSTDTNLKAQWKRSGIFVSGRSLSWRS